MCVESQSLPLSELWQTFCPNIPFGDANLLVLKGYFDESEDPEWFTLGAIFSTGDRWTFLNVDWQRCIERWSKKMVASGRNPLQRYHGTDLAGSFKEFHGWSESERETFLDELRTIINDADGTHTVSLSLRPSELAEVFDLGNPKHVKRGCYQVLLQFMMLELGEAIHSRNPGYEDSKVVMVHDHTKHYDSVIQRAFFELKDDPGFRFSKYFATIAPMCWQDCIALQPADMVAFESRRQVLRTANGRELGGELKKLLDLPTFGGSGRYFRKENLIDLRDRIGIYARTLGKVPPTPKGTKS